MSNFSLFFLRLSRNSILSQLDPLYSTIFSTKSNDHASIMKKFMCCCCCCCMQLT